MATISQTKLRRLARRVQKVLSRRMAGTPQLQALEQQVSAAVARFATLFDQREHDREASKELLSDAKEKLAGLRERMIDWRVALKRDRVTGATELKLSAEVPDDLLNEGTRLLAAIEGAQQSGRITYGAEALASVRPAMESASVAWDAAQNALAARQDQSAEVQKAAEEMHEQLLVLRRALRDILGPQHRDYRLLKTDLSTSERDEDEPDSDEETAVVVAPTVPGEPAPSNGTTVTNGASKPIAA